MLFRVFQHVVICCNQKDIRDAKCISNNEDFKKQIVKEIELCSDGYITRNPRFSGQYFATNFEEKNKTPQNNDTRINLDPRKLNLHENYVHEIILILHGRLSDLDRYGKLNKAFDLYKMFNSLLSVHLIGCNIYHTGVKSLIDHNRGKYKFQKLTLNCASLNYCVEYVYVNFNTIYYSIRRVHAMVDIT